MGLKPPTAAPPSTDILHVVVFNVGDGWPNGGVRPDTTYPVLWSGPLSEAPAPGQISGDMYATKPD